MIYCKNTPGELHCRDVAVLTVIVGVAAAVYLLAQALIG